ncbi:DnaJ-domain-containing protein [Microthyrium microscopicum]|uniref:DnaJ-domain-containing protein n=1 Tax=Microthyrium microscopicum TaxID=703497 RepID=A0A6A6UNR7_9PEZI|nr:DnaJ-domain-containing protein [Microthyrium microscopicum]
MSTVFRSISSHIKIAIPHNVPHRPFTSTPNLRSTHTQQTHYEVLQLANNATPAEIKHKFYTLSKQHHPDLHPNDPNAATRFHRLSNAYTTLSHPSTRTTYDLSLPSSAPSATHPSGSYSSARAGSRPASGLSRRRTQFRGPPPSFYANGGHGGNVHRRSNYKPWTSNWEQPHTSPGNKGEGQNGQSFTGSMHGTGQWDREAHLRTHSNMEARFSARWTERQQQRMEEAEAERRSEAWGAVVRFAMLTGVVGIIFASPVLVGGFEGKKTKE